MTRPGEVVLVRHAMPAFDRDVPPGQWPLSPEGVAAARALRLPAGAYRVASDEVKAWQTLSYDGEVVVDARLREVGRADEPWDGPYRELRRSYVDGTDHPGWEPRADVTARFDAAVAEHLDRAAGRPLVVASHGMAMTVWLSGRIRLDDPGAFWEGLTFPDVVVVPYR